MLVFPTPPLPTTSTLISFSKSSSCILVPHRCARHSDSMHACRCKHQGGREGGDGWSQACRVVMGERGVDRQAGEYQFRAALMQPYCHSHPKPKLNALLSCEVACTSERALVLRCHRAVGCCRSGRLYSQVLANSHLSASYAGEVVRLYHEAGPASVRAGSVLGSCLRCSATTGNRLQVLRRCS